MKPTAREPAAAAEILIVEDDEATVQNLTEFLRQEGYSVASARDGREALVYLRQRPAGHSLPCLILLDLVMPVDGWRFREEQLKDPTLAAVPVVVMSGVYQTQPAARSLNAAAYLPKPIDLHLLLAVIQRFCRPAPTPDPD